MVRPFNQIPHKMSAAQLAKVDARVCKDLRKLDLKLAGKQAA